MDRRQILKELCHNILSHFFDGLSSGSSVEKRKKKWFGKEEKHQRGDSKTIIWMEKIETD